MAYQHRKTRWVKDRHLPLNEPQFVKSPDTPQVRRGRHMHPICEILVRDAGILLESFQQLQVDGV